YELIYREALRALDQQQSVLESMRTRAGTLLSAAAIATAFFSGISVNNTKGLGGWGWGATASFVGVLACCLVILLPTKGWWFKSGPATLASTYLEKSDH